MKAARKTHTSMEMAETQSLSLALYKSQLTEDQNIDSRYVTTRRKHLHTGTSDNFLDQPQECYRQMIFQQLERSA